MAYDLLGKNFTPPDVHAKVTGKAKYSEDFRVDGMVFLKVLTSPMPHARVTSIDASAALAMPGVHGVLTADEITTNPRAPGETILTNEPLFVGHPILAVAADTRRARERRARADQGHVRGAAVHRRSAAEPVPRRTERAHGRQRREPRRRSQDREVDGARLRRGRRRAAADGRARHGMVVRRRRRRPRGRQGRARRDVRHGGSRPSLDGVAQRARVLAERQVLSCSARRRARASRSRASRSSSASNPQISSTSRSSAAAASARRAAPIR